MSLYKHELTQLEFVQGACKVCGHLLLCSKWHVLYAFGVPRPTEFSGFRRSRRQRFILPEEAAARVTHLPRHTSADRFS